MTDNTIYQRKFRRSVEGGIAEATAKLHQIGNQKPYFSVTNGNGAAHDDIRAAFPELELLLSLHLSDEDGQPMHAVANASYYIREGLDGALAKHLRIPKREARKLIDEYLWHHRDEMARVESIRKVILSEWTVLTGMMPREIFISGNVPRRYYKDRPEPPLFEEVLKDNKQALQSIVQWLGFRACGSRASIKRARSPYKGFNDIPKDKRWYKNNRHNPALLECFTDAEILQIDELHRKAYGPYFWGNYDAKNVYKLHNELRKLCGMIDKALHRPVDKTNMTHHEVVQKLVSSCFASCWKRQAEEAIEFLKEPDLLDIAQPDRENPIVDIPGFGIVEPTIRTCGYLPMLDVGGRLYYVAVDSQDAGEKAKEYWKDMASTDKEEFIQMVGEDNIIAWALGESAGPGTKSVTSMDDWFSLWEDTPEEQWASYDGEEVELEINEALADELGWDFQPNSTGTMQIVGYRC